MTTNETPLHKRPIAVALLSRGLDSQLAARMVTEPGI